MWMFLLVYNMLYITVSVLNITRRACLLTMRNDSVDDQLLFFDSDFYNFNIIDDDKEEEEEDNVHDDVCSYLKFLYIRLFVFSIITRVCRNCRNCCNIVFANTFENKQIVLMILTIIL